MADQAPGPDKIGRWGERFNLLNVPVHASLLPTGKILYWGRRWKVKPQDPDPDTITILPLDMNQKATKTFLWTPPKGDSSSSSKAQSASTSGQPKGMGGEDVNLFCSGHCFRPDGSLLVVGGHIMDTWGLNQASVYDPYADTWTAKPKMNNGRWYPSALTMSDGNTLSISGSFLVNEATKMVSTNTQPQIWRDNAWSNISPPPITLINYPRLHLNPKGGVFMAGPQATSTFLRPDGTWEATQLQRAAGEREFAPSVSYDRGKTVFFGGGNNKDDDLPTNITEAIDLEAVGDKLKWQPVKPMSVGRRQHNATVLPDGTVLVTGGTKGSGFSNVQPGNPVHKAELWTPPTSITAPSNDFWTDMAVEDSPCDRCYHSIALLLPDGQVLSSGSGEGADNPPIMNAQLFKPKYFFTDGGKEAIRPTLVTAPSEIDLANKTFEVTVGASDVIKKASWIRIGSVTHANNMSQTFMWLKCVQQGTKVTVDAPDNPNLTPPGHYMLFLLNDKNVPSKPTLVDKRVGDKTIKDVPNNIICIKKSTTISSQSVAQPEPPHPSSRAADADTMHHDLPALNKKIISEQDRPPVKIGLTPVCPYGLGACWGGAYDALQRMSNIDVVRPVPHQPDSVAYVYLKDDVLPDIDQWRDEFGNVANGSYHMRGIEMTVAGSMMKKSDGNAEQLYLAATQTRPEVMLEPFQQTSKLEYDMWARHLRRMSVEEAGAYERLAKASESHPTDLKVQVTGGLHKHDGGQFSLHVRRFELLDDAISSPKL